MWWGAGVGGCTGSSTARSIWSPVRKKESGIEQETRKKHTTRTVQSSESRKPRRVPVIAATALQQVLQQQHVDHKIANSLLRKAPAKPTRNVTCRTALGSTCACTSRTTRRRPQQHYLEARRSIHDQRPVCRLPGHFRPPCSGGLAAWQLHPGSHHLDRPFPSHAQAPARNSSAGLRLHGAAGSKPVRTAIRCGLQRGGKRRGATSTAARSRPRRQFGHPCPSAAQPPP